MKVINLKGKNDVYTSNVYLVLGDWNAIGDVNTLVDVGADPTILHAIDAAHTCLGKHKIDQVVLPHSHFDHMANLPLISETYKPVVCASTHFLEDMDIFLEDGVLFRMGDRWFEVIYMPGHSEDSIALWNEEEGLLFSGDANVIINTPGSSYNSRFIRAIEFLCRKDIKTIYFGHGEPMRSGAQGCPQALNGNDPGMHAKTRGCFVNVRQDKGPSEEKAFSITGIEGGIGNGQ